MQYKLIETDRIDPQCVDPALFRDAFSSLASGVAVIAFEAGGIVHGFTATSLTAVSLDPPLALFCVKNKSASRPHLVRGARVGISLLDTGQVAAARLFAQPTPRDGYRDLSELSGVPVVAHAITAMSAEITELHPAGDHTVCICAIECVKVTHDAEPLIYYARDYHSRKMLLDEVCTSNK